jgi:hypothetical protein
MSITKRYLGIRQQEINDIYLSVSLWVKYLIISS